MCVYWKHFKQLNNWELSLWGWWCRWFCRATRTLQITNTISPPTSKAEKGCAPIVGYDDTEVVRLGGVASGDRMEPSVVTTNTQQATYAIPDRMKKASGCGLYYHGYQWGGRCRYCGKHHILSSDNPIHTIASHVLVNSMHACVQNRRGVCVYMSLL